MKKIFNKLTKFLLLVVFVISELMAPIKVSASGEELPQKGDVGINERVSDTGEVSVTKGELTNPGDVQVTKTVKKSSDGKFNIEFDVKGKDVTTTTTTTKPIYAAVIFDRSGSMEREECKFWFFDCEEVKFSSAVSGAKTFANSLLRNFSNANLALIEFSTNVNIVRGFANANFDNLSFGSPYGGTNLTGALNEAKSLLDEVGNDYTKYIVVISDGAPTGSDGRETSEAANIAIETANSIKEDESIKIYSIGYETDSTTSNTLKKIASGDDYFMEADATAIANKFEEVASSITNSAFAGTNATLTDNIGANFVITATSSENINVGLQSISTSIENITESGTKISFQVEINGDEADGWVNVNEGFNLSYTDVNGNTKNIVYSDNELQPQVYWERNTYNYVINYYKDDIIDDNDHYLGTSGNLSSYNGEEIILSDIQKNAYLPENGYKLSDSNIYSITIDKNKDNIINILYEKIDLKYSVNYLFEEVNGNYKIDNNYTSNNLIAKYGDEVNYNSYLLDNIPNGYELNIDKTEENNRGNYTITDNNTIINIYYKRVNTNFNVYYYFNNKFDEIYSYNGTSKYGTILNAFDYRLEKVNNEYLQNKKSNDNANYFLDPNNNSNSSSIVSEVDNNNMNLYYISTLFDDNNESIDKTITSNNKITNSKELIDYKVNYRNKISNVRKGDIITINIIDTLPFKGDVTNLTDGCIYDNDKTISCIFTETINEFKTEYVVNSDIEYSVVYKDFANISSSNSPKLINTVTGKTTIKSDNITKESNGVTDNAEVDVEIFGNVIVHHYEKGTTNSVYNDEISKALVGTYYETNYKNNLNNYTIDTSNIPSNKDGSYKEEDTVVTYYYTRKKGSILVSYIDEDGNELDSYTSSDLAGNKYNTLEKVIEGYVLKSIPSNNEGIFIADETIYVEYVYSKNNDKYEELPPQTGYENINYIKYILVILFALLIGKKKVIKNI